MKLENIPNYVPGTSDATRVGDAVTIKYSPQLPGVNLPLPMSFPIKWSLSGVQEPTALTMDMDGPVKGIIHWDLEDQANATLVTLSAHYQFTLDAIREALGGGHDKGGLVGKIGHAASGIVSEVISPLFGANSSTMWQSLANLKKMIEG